MSTIPKRHLDKIKDVAMCDYEDDQVNAFKDGAQYGYQLATDGRDAWQLCPKCNGDGNLARYNSPGLSTTTHPICDVCYGAKILASPNSGREELEKELKQLGEFINDIAKLLGEDNLGTDDYKWSIDDFKDAITALQSSLKDKEEKIEQMKKEYQTLYNNYADYGLKYDESIKQLKEKEKEIDYWKDAYQKEVNDVESQSKQIEELKAELEAMRADEIVLKEYFKDQLDELTAENERLKQMVKTQFFKEHDDAFQEQLWNEYSKEHNL